VSGRNIFNPVETTQPLSGWALALVIVGSIAAGACLAGVARTLWLWLVHGQPPKLHPGLARLWQRLPRRRGSTGSKAVAGTKQQQLGNGDDDGSMLSPSAAASKRLPWSEARRVQLA
jgi:hypothetical protein